MGCCSLCHSLELQIRALMSSTPAICYGCECISSSHYLTISHMERGYEVLFPMHLRRRSIVVPFVVWRSSFPLIPTVMVEINWWILIVAECADFKCYASLEANRLLKPQFQEHMQRSRDAPRWWCHKETNTSMDLRELNFLRCSMGLSPFPCWFWEKLIWYQKHHAIF